MAKAFSDNEKEIIRKRLKGHFGKFIWMNVEDHWDDLSKTSRCFSKVIQMNF